MGRLVLMAAFVALTACQAHPQAGPSSADKAETNREDIPADEQICAGAEENAYDPDAVIDACNRLLDIPELRPARDRALELTQRSIAYIQKGEIDLAVAPLNEAIELDPESFESFLARGQIESEKGEVDAAIRDCRRAFQLAHGASTVIKHGDGSIFRCTIAGPAV